jgi:hypothetical protein
LGRVQHETHVIPNERILTREMLSECVEEFYKRWNFPNCFGCTDGKNIHLKCPTNAGSMYYNYKQYHSIVLQGIAVANHKFICIDIGSYGKQIDGEIFSSKCTLFQHSKKKISFFLKSVFQELN